jgi:uroporphyrin-III C-methyltransferase
MSALEGISLALPDFGPGEVWLVGAGPGDPGLLTLHAVNALQHADVIVYDALVSDAVMALARKEATREFAGKRGGKPSAVQNDITDRLIEFARQNKRVLRLKGGDPFVFGRGGEEALGLAAAGIPFRVVPGLTAGLAGLAYAAIPATTRRSNRGIILATGHSAIVGEPALDWASLARTGLPVILYMAMMHLSSITAAWLAAGAAPETPVAIIAEATTPRQRVLVTTLARAKADAEAKGLVAPAIVAIGKIVDLHAALAPLCLTLKGEA